MFVGCTLSLHKGPADPCYYGYSIRILNDPPDDIKNILKIGSKESLKLAPARCQQQAAEFKRLYNQAIPIVSQLDKCLKFKSIRGDKNDYTLHKITPRNAINFRYLSSCGTIAKTAHYAFEDCTFWVWKDTDECRSLHCKTTFD